MITFLLMTCIIALALGLVSYVSSKRSNRTPEASALTLLPGDIKYESPSGRVHFLLSHSDVDRHQHHTQLGFLSVAVATKARADTLLVEAATRLLWTDQNSDAHEISMCYPSANLHDQS